MRDVPRKYKKLYQKAIETVGRKAKIRFFCLECCGFEAKEVEKCTDLGCVFYKLRQSG